MTDKYGGEWKDLDDVKKDFFMGAYNYDKHDYDVGAIPSDFPTEDEIIYAGYEYEDYSGYAWVVYQKDGILYEVHGSHCSCYGLEGQWSPEETSATAIRMRDVHRSWGLEGRELKTVVALLDGIDG